MLSVRASEEEVARVKKFAAELIKKNRYLKEADILRELIGLEDTGIITQEMRKRLLCDEDAHQSAYHNPIPIEPAGLPDKPPRQVFRSPGYKGGKKQ